MDFYATAAQVIPTLFLAMAVADGLLSRARPPDPHFSRSFSLAAFYITAIMIIGELSALATLAVGRSVSSAAFATWVGLLAGLAGVALPVAREHWLRFRAARRNTLGTVAWVFVVAGVPAAVVLVAMDFVWG